MYYSILSFISIPFFCTLVFPLFFKPYISNIKTLLIVIFSTSTISHITKVADILKVRLRPCVILSIPITISVCRSNFSNLPDLYGAPLKSRFTRAICFYRSKSLSLEMKSPTSKFLSINVVPSFFTPIRRQFNCTTCQLIKIKPF